MALNETHDPHATSWVESANDPAGDFPIQNLPLARVTLREGLAPGEGVPTLAAVIGDQCVFLDELAEIGFFRGAPDPSASDALAADQDRGVRLDADGVRHVRRRLFSALRATASHDDRATLADAMVPLADVSLWTPAHVGNYTDFYASIHHASTVGAMFRPDNPLLPNYKHVPIGYHGRASSIVPSGSPVRRPLGQQSPPDNTPGAGPSFGPCKMLDYELEVGCVIGPGNALGQPVPVGQASRQILGLCLVNDWSARDIQKWEYQPLGPFLAKNFATTVSPFLVTLDALEPFRCPAYARPAGDPAPLAYLADAGDQASGGFDITLEVLIQSQAMLAKGLAPMTLSRANAFRDMYWTFAQMIAHHTSNGCNLTPGDLLASGTVSGLSPDSRGCLLELTWDGTGKPRKPITLPTGETRTFLADGDTVIIRGWCEKPGFRRIGFGECRGTITPSPA